MPHQLKILIVGAGIAGLAAATALHRRGLAVEIVERRHESPPGAGLFLPGNAVRALTELGLGDHLTEYGVPIHAQRLRDHRGRLLGDIDMATLWQGVAGPVGITHNQLRSGLYDRLGLPVRTGITVRSVTETAAGVDVEFSDGGTGHYDVVVGADGINSELRARVSPTAETRYVGQICWRFLTDNAAGIDRWTVWLGRGATFLAVPVGTDQLYCYADLSTAEPATGEAVESTLADRFSHFAAPVADLLTTPAARNAYFSTIEEVVDETWRTDRIVLIGDAAHASSPNMAQGVAMAVEDALVLAETLAGEGNTADLLENYRQRRLPRTRWVQARSHRRDRTRSLAPIARNTVLRLAAHRLYERDYAQLRDLP